MSLRVYVLALFARVLIISWIVFFVRNVVGDVSTLEKICNFSYHCVVVSEVDPFFGVGECIIV